MIRPTYNICINILILEYFFFENSCERTLQRCRSSRGQVGGHRKVFHCSDNNRINATTRKHEEEHEKEANKDEEAEEEEEYEEEKEKEDEKEQEKEDKDVGGAGGGHSASPLVLARRLTLSRCGDASSMFASRSPVPPS